MNIQGYNILLADDDCVCFKETLDELPTVTVKNGAHLMFFLADKAENLVDILLLHLTMLRKNSTKYLTKIRQINKLQHLSVTIFSTSLNIHIVNTMYEKGIFYSIIRAGNYTKLKKITGNIRALISKNNLKQPDREHFILEA